MPRHFLGLIAVSVMLVFGPAAMAAPAHENAAPVHAKRQITKQRLTKHHVTKRRVTRHWHGYGFLPGYRPPHVVERERAEHYWQSGPHYYGPAWPRFYRGRWNGGGFGPCYTQTPIGPMWNCGQ